MTTNANTLPIMNSLGWNNVFHYIQKQSIIELAKYSVARAILPTGAGKTKIEGAMIANDILEKKSLGIFHGVYVVTSPRILLSTQLMISTQETIAFECDITTNIMLVNSGGVKRGGSEVSDFSKEYMKKMGTAVNIDDSSTSVGQIINNITKSKLNNQPIVIYANYQSASRLTSALNVLNIKADMIINDEAHFLVSSQYRGLFDSNAKKLNQLIKQDNKESNETDEELKELKEEVSKENILETDGIPSVKRYFFTATEKYTDGETNIDGKGLGNNNESIYGPIAIEKSIYDVIDSGFICRPELSVLTGLTGMPVDPNTMGSLISKTVELAEIKLKSDSNQKLRMLVNTGGSKQMEWFMKSKSLNDLLDQGYNIAIAASNKDVGYVMRGKIFEGNRNYPKNGKINRNIWLKILKEEGENSNTKMIVLHHKILTVGIDVQGFNTVLMLYVADKSYFFQSLGRSLRINKTDRSNFSKGLIKPFDLTNTGWIKPYGLLIVPEYLTEISENAKQAIKDLINQTLVTSEKVTILDCDGKKIKEDPVKQLSKEVYSISNIFEELELDDNWIRSIMDGSNEKLNFRR